MIHIVHMIQRRREARPLPFALSLSVLSAMVLLAGLGLLPGR